MGAESVARRLRDPQSAGGERPPARASVLAATTALRRPLTYVVIIALLVTSSPQGL